MNTSRHLLISLAIAFSCAALAQSDEPERVRIHGSNVLGDRLVPALVVGWLKSIEYEQIRRRDISPVRTEISAERDGEKLVVEIANPDPNSPYQALSLSQERVDYVASELLGLDMKVVTVRGMGGQMALIDSGQPGSRYRNDRVEVWLR